MRKTLALFISLLATSLHAFDTQNLKETLQKPDNIQGEFVQERQLKNLPQPIESSGEFVLIPSKLLLWQMKMPFAVTLRVRDDGVAQQNAQGQWQQNAQNARQVALFMALLAGDTATLEKQFDLQLQGDAENWQLRLTPKDALLKQVFVHITLQGDDFVREVLLEETQGDRSVLRFANIRADSPLPPTAEEALQK